MFRRLARWLLLGMPTLLLAASACHVTDMAIWSPTPNAGPAPFEVAEVRDVVYRSGPEKDPYRRRVDLFLPKGQRGFPVVVLVHGGAWIIGDNRCCGLYSSVGQFLASQGIGAILPNYRLSPGVTHPAHVEDIAQAVAWAKKHIVEYGGRPDQIFLVGHSAGGHLVTLLATDDRYLIAQGLTTDDIRGVVAVSGVYHLPPGPVHGTLGGSSAQAFHVDEVIPVRGTSPVPKRAAWPTMSLDLNLYGMAFGDDPRVREDASPLNHVHPRLPPFLLINADNELPTLAGMTEEFQRALLAAGCDVRVMRIPDRNHSSVMFHAVSSDDPVAVGILSFIRELSGPYAGAR